MKALKLLCLNGADINKRHKKSGFTPLRFAIEKQNIDVVSYILQQADVDPMIEDFSGVNPLQAALKKENSELLEVITEYMVVQSR
jgi:ankyrin repeat protein